MQTNSNMQRIRHATGRPSYAAQRADADRAAHRQQQQRRQQRRQRLSTIAGVR